MKLLTVILLSATLGACASKVAEYPAPVTPDWEKLDSWNWPKPERWDAAFDKFDEEGEQPKNAIVAIGSSSMRGWHKSIDEDLAPLTFIKRGFGGSDMYDVVHFAERGILAYEPRAVLLYEGDNDIAANKPPEAVMDAFNALQYKIHTAYPDTRIYIVSIKPSISRWEKWPAMVEANDLLKEKADQDPRLFYIDVASPMIGENGEPLPDIFLSDNLHMNRKGYDIWTEAVRPVLMENELAFEQ